MGWSPAIAAAGNPDRAEALARTITQPDYQAEARPRFSAAGARLPGGTFVTAVGYWMPATISGW